MFDSFGCVVNRSRNSDCIITIFRLIHGEDTCGRGQHCLWSCHQPVHGSSVCENFPHLMLSLNVFLFFSSMCELIWVDLDRKVAYSLRSYTHIHTHIHILMHKYSHAYTHTYAQILTCIHAYIHTCAHHSSSVLCNPKALDAIKKGIRRLLIIIIRSKYYCLLALFAFTCLRFGVLRSP
jgi:hypothetical protein